MAADYTRGEMNISGQEHTFSGFVRITLWSSMLLGLLVFYLTLVFAAGADWMTSLIGVAVLGYVLGLVTSMKTAWNITVGGMLVFGLICGGLAQLFSVFLAG